MFRNTLVRHSFDKSYEKKKILYINLLIYFIKAHTKLPIALKNCTFITSIFGGTYESNSKYI